MLDDLPDDRHARGAQELAQLGEVVAARQGGDAERALLGAAGLLPAGELRGFLASVAALLHPWNSLEAPANRGQASACHAGGGSRAPGRQGERRPQRRVRLKVATSSGAPAVRRS